MPSTGRIAGSENKPFATFLTVMVIAISDAASVCYIVYKNVNRGSDGIIRLRKSLFICKNAGR